MNATGGDRPRIIRAIKVRQWMPEWDSLDYADESYRGRPRQYFYLFSISATDLKALSGIRRRSLEGRLEGGIDKGIQRAHNTERSDEISRFIRYGFPWSSISDARRRSGNYDDLRKPGWLPTSIVINILDKDYIDLEERGVDVDDDDLVTISELSEDMVSVQLPTSFNGSDWVPKRQYPIEVIDGQHRLWAFEETAQDSDFQLPVVAFHGLDLSWQAYLFYTINIKPVRINTSLAFDLYPLLRTEDWLERVEGPAVYRETRAQELTQALWATRSSPWFKHINMLGESGLKAMVRQASWIRSLTATYVKTERGTRIGGLFGRGTEKGISRWNGAQQAAFLILVGQKIQEAINDSDYEWAQSLRTEEKQDLLSVAYVAITKGGVAANVMEGSGRS